MADARATAVARAEKLLDVYTEQIKISGQIDGIREQLKTIPDHENRIRDLERFKFTLMGVSVVGGLTSGFVGYFIGHLVH